MTFTEEQIQILSKYEEHFTTAVKGNWSRYPGSIALDEIHSIYCEVTGDKRKNNKSCSNCILNLLKDCGKLYFQDKDEWSVLRAKKIRKRASTKTSKS